MLVVEKASAAASAVGSGVAVVSGTIRFLGLSTEEWTIVGIIGGLACGVVFGVVNAIIHNHWKKKQYKLEVLKIQNEWNVLGE